MLLNTSHSFLSGLVVKKLNSVVKLMGKLLAEEKQSCFFGKGFHRQKYSQSPAMHNGSHNQLSPCVYYTTVGRRLFFLDIFGQHNLAHLPGVLLLSLGSPKSVDSTWTTWTSKLWCVVLRPWSSFWVTVGFFAPLSHQSCAWCRQ